MGGKRQEYKFVSVLSAESYNVVFRARNNFNSNSSNDNSINYHNDDNNDNNDDDDNNDNNDNDDNDNNKCNNYHYGFNISVQHLEY